MPLQAMVGRKYLAGTLVAVSVASLCYLVLGHSPSDVPPQALALRVDALERILQSVQQEQRDLKEDTRMLRVALENASPTAPEQRLAPSASTPAASAPTGPAPASLDAARRHWVATEYPTIVQKSQANAAAMVDVLGAETGIAKEKLAPMKDIFSEASVRIANAIANADDMNDVRAINGRIAEINQWKDESLSALLSREEFNQYKSINWQRRLSGMDRGGHK